MVDSGVPAGITERTLERPAGCENWRFLISSFCFVSTVGLKRKKQPLFADVCGLVSVQQSKNKYINGVFKDLWAEL